MTESQAIIYLADHRPCFQTETFRSYLTLLPSHLHHATEPIIKFADNTLSAQKTTALLADDDYVVVLLPLVGALEIAQQENAQIVNSGEIAYVFLRNKSEVLLQNPYENELINYVEIWVKYTFIHQEKVLKNSFSLDKNWNKFIEVSVDEIPQKIFIGKFSGRKEETLSTQNKAFVFVINGVFEVQNRLIETRTALSLWDLETLEFEGLASENIILIITE